MIIPFIFLPLLVAASGFLSWEMFRRGDVASWCSFFTAGGVFLVETVYGYFISNIIGLCLIFLSLALLLRYLRVGGRVLLSVSIITGLFSYFSHPQTAEVYIGGLAALWIIQLLRRNSSRRAMIAIPFYLTIIVVLWFPELVPDWKPSLTESLLHRFLFYGDPTVFEFPERRFYIKPNSSLISCARVIEVKI